MPETASSSPDFTSEDASFSADSTSEDASFRADSISEDTSFSAELTPLSTAFFTLAQPESVPQSTARARSRAKMCFFMGFNSLQVYFIQIFQPFLV